MIGLGLNDHITWRALESTRRVLGELWRVLGPELTACEY